LDIVLSEHAIQRSAQRNVSFEEIAFIIEHGRLMRNAGVSFRQLREKDWPDNLPTNHCYRRLIGTTIVLCKCGLFVVTLYREAEAFRKDRRKTRYNAAAHWVACPRCRRVIQCPIL
jgi:hypothetical protein